MNRPFKFALALALAASSVAAHAGYLDVRFNGIVDTQQNTAFAIGSSIAGEFVYDTGIGRYVSFVVGGQSVAPGFASTASITPDRFSSIYRAQVSPLSGGNLNSTFVVDLEGIDPWSTTNAIGLLQATRQLALNLDTTLSSFGFFTGNADGTNVRSLSATLATVQVTAVPEPGSIALLAIGFTALLARRARRAPG